ncbi:MAG: hypothetical protein D6679_00445 [Candidatus Hydrogenedentota bacterium]|nr:MAG: hypothetical protein D6679_00445 [Candidatus Hydrogenedentota bacterium]
MGLGSEVGLRMNVRRTPPPHFFFSPSNENFSEENGDYFLESDGTFRIRDFDRKPPFASFLPGVAGECGRPLWCFYVNRGQAVVSAGVGTKDGAFLEFEPANKAFAVVSQRGFRTFIREEETGFWEPFAPRRNCDPVLTRWMEIRPWEVSLREENQRCGWHISLTYYTIPQAPFPGLVRKVTLQNLYGSDRRIHVLDGLPVLIPYGAKAILTQTMARTLEAFFEVENLEEGMPFFRLRIIPDDKPLVRKVRGGFFASSGRLRKSEGWIVDPQEVFGRDTSLSLPDVFLEGNSRPTRKYLGNTTPSAFLFLRRKVPAREKTVWYEVFGWLPEKRLLDLARKTLSARAYFERAREKNAALVAEIGRNCATCSGDIRFDFYARQNFLDNVLRGGLAIPVAKGAKEQEKVLHLYSRKHGDLERDYNDFLLEPTYCSQGNGNYRDVCQNRRNDVFFEPAAGLENIRLFVDLLQIDGWNPLVIEPVRYRWSRRPKQIEKVLPSRCRLRKKEGERLKNLLKRSFRPAEVVAWAWEVFGGDRGKAWRLAREILKECEPEISAKFGDGYWVDHWTYVLDLIENYLLFFPERKRELLFARSIYRFYRPEFRVLPRSETLVFSAAACDVRRAPAVKKENESASRSGWLEVTGADGKRHVLEVNLFAKLLTVVLNKLCSLDPQGRGIEMAADKPGWNDAMNGLPALLGSSVAEGFELLRWIRFLCAELEATSFEGVSLPFFIADFAEQVFEMVMTKREKFVFWNESHTLREAFLNRMEGKVPARFRVIERKKLLEGLAAAEQMMNRNLRTAFRRTDGLPHTYFRQNVTRFEYKKQGKKRLRHESGDFLVEPKGFRAVPLPLFLEGAVRAMRTFPRKARQIHRALLKSPLYDRKLGMFRLNESLQKEPLEIGRARTFRRGWLENETIWLHMEYKYLLELLRAGLYEEFFSCWRRAGIPNQDPARYGRSILENSSFLASSVVEDADLVGRGFVARLSGSTAEFISIWLFLMLGPRPFSVDDHGLLQCRFSPILKKDFFLIRAGELETPKGRIRVPVNSCAFLFRGRVPVIYNNPLRIDTWKARIERVVVEGNEGEKYASSSGFITGRWAECVRRGEVGRIEVDFGKGRGIRGPL